MRDDDQLLLRQLRLRAGWIDRLRADRQRRQGAARPAGDGGSCGQSFLESTFGEFAHQRPHRPLARRIAQRGEPVLRRVAAGGPVVAQAAQHASASGGSRSGIGRSFSVAPDRQPSSGRPSRGCSRRRPARPAAAPGVITRATTARCALLDSDSFASGSSSSASAPACSMIACGRRALDQRQDRVVHQPARIRCRCSPAAPGSCAPPRRPGRPPRR